MENLYFNTGAYWKANYCLYENVLTLSLLTVPSPKLIIFPKLPTG